MIADTVDLLAPINDYSITVGWLLKSLRDNDKVYQKLYGNRPVKEIKAIDVSGGKGYASEILRCTIVFDDSTSPSDTYTTILKIPGFDSLIKVTKATGGDTSWMDESRLLPAHETECHFYNNLAPILDVPVPIVHKTQDWELGKVSGCVHMEDLTRRGRVLGFYEGANLTQVRHVIAVLARMHKNVLSMDPKDWRGKYSKDPELFTKVLDIVNPLFEPFLKMSKREAELKPLFDKYRKFADSKEFCMYSFDQSYQDLNLAPVIVHGDMHPGNIMWGLDENGDVTTKLAAIVDWQTLHEGNPVSDLARFLTMCTSGVVRRQAETFAIEYYLECLVKEFQGDSSKVPYTLEALQKAYKFAFLSQVFNLPGVAVFTMKDLNEKETNQALKDAYIDWFALRTLQGFQDADRLLQGEMKDVFEKYGK